MDKRVIVAIALCLGVLIVWTQLFSPPPKPAVQTPVATSPAGGDAGQAAGAGAAPAAAGATPARGRNRCGAGRQSPRASGRAADAARALRVLQPGRHAGARPAAREAVPRQAQRSEHRPRSRARGERPGHAVPHLVLRVGADDAGRWRLGGVASPRPTRWSSPPTAATSTSRSATVWTRRSYRLYLDVVLSNRGDAPVNHNLAIAADGPAGSRQARRRHLLGRCRPTCRRRSVTSTVKVERESIEGLTQTPKVHSRRGHVGRDGREVLPAVGGAVRGAARAGTGRAP